MNLGFMEENKQCILPLQDIHVQVLKNYCNCKPDFQILCLHNLKKTCGSIKAVGKYRFFMLLQYVHKKYCVAIHFFQYQFIGKCLGSEIKFDSLKWLKHFCDCCKHKDRIFLLLTEQKKLCIINSIYCVWHVQDHVYLIQLSFSA